MHPESSHSTTRKREGDSPMLPSSKRVFKETLESVPNDLDDATHKALDDDVLTEVGGSPSMAIASHCDCSTFESTTGPEIRRLEGCEEFDRRQRAAEGYAGRRMAV
jgi:hypothetical protein